jgi:hypothetical protein
MIIKDSNSKGSKGSKTGYTHLLRVFTPTLRLCVGGREGVVEARSTRRRVERTGRVASSFVTATPTIYVIMNI